MRDDYYYCGNDDSDDGYFEEGWDDEMGVHCTDDDSDSMDPSVQARFNAHQARVKIALELLARRQFGGIENTGLEFSQLIPKLASKPTGPRGSCVSAGNGCKRPEWLINVPITDGLAQLLDTLLGASWLVPIAEGDVVLVSANDGSEFQVSRQLLALHSPVFEQLLLEQSAKSTASSSSLPAAPLSSPAAASLSSPAAASSSAPPVCKLCLDEPHHEVALLLAAISLPESEEVFNPRTAYTLARLARKYDMKRVLLMIGDIVILSNSSKWKLTRSPPSRDDRPSVRGGRRAVTSRGALSGSVNPHAAHTQQTKASNEAWEQKGVMYLNKKFISSPQHVLQLLYLTQYTAHNAANKCMLDLLASGDSYDNNPNNLFEGAEIHELPELTQGIGLALAATCARKLRKRNPILHFVKRKVDSLKRKDSSQQKAVAALKRKDSSQQTAVASKRQKRALDKRQEQMSTLARKKLVLRVCVALYFYLPLFRQHSSRRQDRQLIAKKEVGRNAVNRGPGELELNGSGSADTSHKNPQKTCSASKVACRQTGKANSELMAKTANGDIILDCKRDKVSVRAHTCMLRQHSDVLRYMLTDCFAATTTTTQNGITTASAHNGSTTASAQQRSAAGSASTPATYTLPVDDTSKQWLAALAVIYPLNDDGGCPVDNLHSVLELADKYNMVAVKRRVLAHWSTPCHLVGLLKGGADAKQMRDVLRLLSVCSTDSLDLGSRMCETLLADDHLAAFFAAVVDVPPSKAPVLSPEAWWVVLKYLSQKAYGY